MAKNPFSSFEEGFLRALLQELNVPVPDGADQATLAGMVFEVNKLVKKEDFANAVARANGIKAVTPGDGSTTSTDGSVTNPLTPGAKSIVPGSSVLWTVLAGVGSVGSQTWDPPTPVEYGRTTT